MSNSRKQTQLAVFVGSRHDQMCSVGSFARSETKAFQKVYSEVALCEPSENGVYPDFSLINTTPDIIFFHSPSLSDRKAPWSAIENAIKIRLKFPKAKFISIVHEFTEAPLQWKLRQAALLMLSNAAITNTEADYQSCKRFCKKILRSKLGPTLFYDELLENPQTEKLKLKIDSNKIVLQKFIDLQNIKNCNEFIVHPGLVTPGKGVNQLKEFIPYVPKNTALILMGGLGPKQKDLDFADAVKAELSKMLPERFAFILNPSDSEFSSVINAADLVLLPYDIGLSERRSSFLSAMSCGANVFTTIGHLSHSMQPERSGAFLVDVHKWQERDQSVFEVFKSALSENNDLRIQRRIKNLIWASNYSWSNRTKETIQFIETNLL